MHQMTFDPNCDDLIWCFPFQQQGKISSVVFAYIDKPSGTVCPKSAYTSKKRSLITPVCNLINQVQFFHCEIGMCPSE